jgi:hypothetical protein
MALAAPALALNGGLNLYCKATSTIE